MKIPSPAWNNKRGPHPCLDIKKGGCIFKKKKKKEKLGTQLQNSCIKW